MTQPWPADPFSFFCALALPFWGPVLAGDMSLERAGVVVGIFQTKEGSC